MIKLTGIWKHTDKDGKEFFTGNLGKGRLVMFKNNFKEKDGPNSPDYVLYLTEQREQKQDVPQ